MSSHLLKVTLLALLALLSLAVTPLTLSQYSTSMGTFLHCTPDMATCTSLDPTNNQLTLLTYNVATGYDAGTPWPLPNCPHPACVPYANYIHRLGSTFMVYMSNDSMATGHFQSYRYISSALVLQFQTPVSVKGSTFPVGRVMTSPPRGSSTLLYQASTYEQYYTPGDGTSTAIYTNTFSTEKQPVISRDAQDAVRGLFYKSGSYNDIRIKVDTKPINIASAPPTQATNSGGNSSYVYDLALACFDKLTNCSVVASYKSGFSTGTNLRFARYNPTTNIITTINSITNTDARMIYLTENARFLTTSGPSGLVIYEYDGTADNYLEVQTITPSTITLDNYDRLFVSEDGTKAYFGAMSSTSAETAFFMSCQLIYTAAMSGCTKDPALSSVPVPSSGGSSSSSSSSSSGGLSSTNVTIVAVVCAVFGAAAVVAIIAVIASRPTPIQVNHEATNRKMDDSRLQGSRSTVQLEEMTSANKMQSFKALQSVKRAK